MTNDERLIASPIRTVRLRIRPARRQRSPSVALLVLLLTLAALMVRAADETAPLTTVEQVRRLSPDTARLGVPVVLRGVVTYYDAAWNFLFLQDTTGGVFVRGPATEFPLARGQRIELTGITISRGSTMGIEKPSIRILEQSSLPKPRPATFQQVASREVEAQFVEVRGVVRAVITADKRAALHLHTGTDELNVVLRDVLPSDPQLARLLDAAVRVRGVNSTASGFQGRVRSLRLLVPDLDDVTVEQAPPEKPFSIPTSPIAMVAPGEHRIKVFGRVTNVTANGVLVLADDTGLIEVRSPPGTPVRPGDMAETLGFPVRAGERVILDHAVFRSVALTGKTNSTGIVTRLDLPAPPYLPLLQRIDEVRTLQPEEADLYFPVRLRGMVTFYSSVDNYLFIHDGTNGIYVSPAGTNLALRPGHIVEVTGHSHPGRYVPVVMGAQVKLLAHGELPAPHETSFALLMSGKEDGQWISINGIVRSTRQWEQSLWLNVATSGGTFTVMVPSFGDSAPADHLIDAEIRVSGVCGATVNQRRQILGAVVFSPGIDYITVNHPAPSDPFLLPTRTIVSLFQFNPEEKPGHRVKIKGVVTVQRRPNTMYVKDATAPLWISLAQASDVKPGDEVEVVGFPEVNRQLLGLQSAIFRKTGTAPVPTPVPLNLDQASAGALDADYVTTSARFIELSRTPGPLTLVVQSKSTLFEAAFNKTNALPMLQQLKPGSLLRLTGICSTQRDEHAPVRSFRLLLNSEADIILLRPPPWWTIQHAITLAAILTSLIAAALMWVVLLRRQVRQQTGVIQERLAQEAQLESRYRELFENANDMVYTTDLDARITSFNKAAEQLTGCPRAEALGRNLADFLAPEHAGVLPVAPAQLDTNGHSCATKEFIILARDGRSVPVEVSAKLLTHDGWPTGVQGIARDITDRKRAEDAIHQLNANLERRVAERTSELEASNKELEAFSYSVSHDLRAPLRAINGFAEILLKISSPRLDDRGQRYLRKVAAGGRKMGQLVDDLLAFSRLNRQPLAKTAIDLSELAHEHLDDLRRLEPQREVRVDFHPLPPAQGDRSLLTQVLVNLLNNAWKFTQKIPQARIEIGAQGTNGETIYYIRDNGAGFDMNYAGKLFGVFHRLHSDEEFPGTGVGLAIVHRVITRHGGRVWAEARPNEGATFYFTLPNDSSKKEP